MRDFLDELTDDEAAQVAAAMADVRRSGVEVAKHLRRDLYEVVADGLTRSFRVIFSTEGHYSHVLLALVAFSKKTQKTPVRILALAEQRLNEWRGRGEHRP